MATGLPFLCLWLFLSLIPVHSQSSQAVPPVQWINLSFLLSGSSAPPPLRDAAIGYDDSSRSLIIFGGESEGGFVQAQTYLLNLNNLSWSVPSPPTNLDARPAARSSAISGLDFAASNRHAFVVIGGKGSGGRPLSDAWAYDFINQFWSQIQISPGGPSPRWGAAGGLDYRIAPVQDTILPGPNNTFYLAGGTDNQNVFPLSDVWRLNISGILAANLPQDVKGSWERISIERTLPGKVRHGGTIIGQQIISTGGCEHIFSDGATDSTCAQQSSYVIDLQRQDWITPNPCPAPRLDPVVVPNVNAHSLGFANQIFLALGVFNSSVWNDQNGMEKGEVDVLDVNTGIWSRILPAGDPDSAVTFPTAREGAAAFSFNGALVGTPGPGVSDTIIFGGRDSSGRYLSELWLLRTFAASVSSTNASWSGYGDGRLRSGINADGQGVNVQFMAECALAKTPSSPSSPNNNNDTAQGDPVIPPPTHATPHATYDTSLIHKILSPVSLALLLLSFLLLHLFPSNPISHAKQSPMSSVLIIFVTIASFAVGIAGFIVSFTSLTILDPNSASSAITSKSFLPTAHGKASFILFLCLYVLGPVVLLASSGFKLSRIRSSDNDSQAAELRRPNSVATSSEKHEHGPLAHSPTPNGLYSPSGSLRPRALSGTSNTIRRSFDALSSDGESVTLATGNPTPAKRGFEVLNRPARARKQSESLSAASLGYPIQTSPSSRALSDIDWLSRRRSINAISQLDYELSVAQNALRNSVATAEPLAVSTSPLLPPSKPPRRPPLLALIAYILIQLSFLGLIIVTLIVLWSHAHRAAFGVFLAWAVAFYVILFFSPHKFPIERYLLSLLSRRHRDSTLASTPSRDDAIPMSPTPDPTLLSPTQGPYLHHPPFIRTVPADPSHANSDPHQTDDDDDIDDDTRQRMIEEEMDRREVSIVTIPKRKLWVANPSTD